MPRRRQRLGSISIVPPVPGRLSPHSGPAQVQFRPGGPEISGGAKPQRRANPLGKESGVGDFVGSGCGSTQTCDVSLLAAPLNANGKTGASLVQVLSVLSDQGNDLLFGSGIADQQSGMVSNPNAIPSGQSTYDQMRSIGSVISRTFARLNART